jgi:hypothetical protein
MNERQHRYNVSEKGRAARRRYAATEKGKAKSRWAKAKYRRRVHGRYAVIPSYVRADGTVVRSFKRRIGRNRRVYQAARHGAIKDHYNAERRARYVPHTERAKRRKWRAERMTIVEAQLKSDRDGQLRFAGTIPELVALIAAQERDARTFTIKRSPIFIPAEEADRLFYGGVGLDRSA